VFTAEALLAAQGVVRRMPVGEKVVEAILDLVRACRPGEPEGRDLADALAWGPGPRAAQALMLTVRARALLQGRLAPSVEDVAALAQACLEHRMALSFAARARGETLEGIISRVTTRVLGLEAAA
jgi:MoxR-like ATPase